MFLQKHINKESISFFLNKIVSRQYGSERNMCKDYRKKNGVFLTNSLNIVDNILGVVDFNNDIFSKRFLEPSCGHGIFVLKLISDLFHHFPDERLITNFISKNIFFVDIQKEMIETTKTNIKNLYSYIFGNEFQGTFNAITFDFTAKTQQKQHLFDITKETPFSNLYSSFDYVIGNPPYVTLYGRRDKKQSEEQRINYLSVYNQFPKTVKNGKINYVMLFLEHSLDLLKDYGKLSFVIDVSFFETAYEYTRKFLLDYTQIEELHINIKDFDVASGQVIIKLTKSKSLKSHKVIITDWKKNHTYTVLQSSWKNKEDKYKFRYNGCNDAKDIIDKIKSKNDKNILELYPNKNLRTCVMLLNMEDKFTFQENTDKDNTLLYPYYQGSKSLTEKYGKLRYCKYFYYNKPLQDSINEKLKIQLEKEGIKNKKRIGLGETIIYNNPKLYIRQSAKEIIATVDLVRSSANNSLYVFSLRNNSPDTIDFLYFLCGWLNSDLITYYAQQMSIIRYSQGKQPQIKISDLGTIFLPSDELIRRQISEFSRKIYDYPSQKNEFATKINGLVNFYYDLTQTEVQNIVSAIKSF